MKICIPTETNDGKKANVFGHFGSAPYFTIYDTESGELEILDNNNSHHAHGTCNPIAALAGKKVDIVVSGGMGMRAVMILNQSGIKAYRTQPGTVEQTLTWYSQNKLDEITGQNACASHDCH
jgi:predicted Fe-Mo cluster-binding NifX family protein